jgi:LysM repeat protein
VLLIGAAVVIGLIIRGRGTDNADQNEPVQPPIDTNVVPDDNDNGNVQPVVLDETASDDNEAPPLPPMEIDVDPNAESNPQATVLVGEALEFMAADPPNLIGARDRLNDALKLQINAQQRLFIKEQLASMAERWLFNRDVYPADRLCSTYKVQSGDQLSAIASKFKVPYEIIMVLNHISRPEALQAGQTLKVIHGPFNVKIRRSTFTMDLYLQDMYVRSFRIGLGRPGRETPTGLWCVKNRLVKPPWTDPDTGRRYEPDDEDYPLGTRWIGLTGLEGAAKDRTGFAIHGTKDPEEIGAAVSRGCIRMYNGDVVLLYDLLVPTTSLVRVED